MDQARKHKVCDDDDEGLGKVPGRGDKMDACVLIKTCEMLVVVVKVAQHAPLHFFVLVRSWSWHLVGRP